MLMFGSNILRLHCASFFSILYKFLNMLWIIEISKPKLTSGLTCYAKLAKKQNLIKETKWCAFSIYVIKIKENKSPCNKVPTRN